MTRNQVVRLAAVSVLALAGTACATRGNVQTAVDELRDEQRIALANEVAARQAADAELEARVQQRLEARIEERFAALRTDLDELRREFGVRISAMQDTLKFAVPVHFEFDDATVRPTDHAVLERFARVVMHHYPGARITVEGFADPAGSVAYNVDLSQRRAEAVRAELVNRGLASFDLNAVGYGKTRLVTPGAWGDAPGAELNRRVVFAIETDGSPLRVMTSASGGEGRQ